MKFNLQSRAFEAVKFHSKCDNKPNTLIIIKSKNANIFGGYTEQSWNQVSNYLSKTNNEDWKADPNSLLLV